MKKKKFKYEAANKPTAGEKSLFINKSLMRELEEDVLTIRIETKKRILKNYFNIAEWEPEVFGSEMKQTTIWINQLKI